MALVFITGAPGAGKTAVTHEIAERGYNIYDTDDPDRTRMAGWHNLETGQYVAGFNELEVTEELLRTHVWQLTDKALDEFNSRAVDELIYLCGRLRDARKVIAVSRQLVFLTVSAETIESRLTARSRILNEVEWGRDRWQIDRSISVNQEIEAEYRLLGAIMIDANQPLDMVVDDILQLTT